MEALINQSIGGSKHSQDRYLIESLLGKQTGRRTFLAKDSQTEQRVVLKLILFGPDFTWEDLKLFEREAKTLKSLDHPAIPKYLDSFEVETLIGKGFVLVQTYIEARSLREWAIAGRRFSESELKEMARSLLEILQYLHIQSPAVIHRDIKPSNILLGDRTAHSVGKLYLIDFGSVQTVAHGGTVTVVGTYGYMPPEQFGGRAVPASDLYSLAMTLAYLMTGQHPSDLVRKNDRLSLSRADFSSTFVRWIHDLSATELSKRIASVQTAVYRLDHAETSGELAQTNSSFRQELVQNGLRISSTSEEFKVRFMFERLGGTPFRMIPKAQSGCLLFIVLFLLLVLAYILPWLFLCTLILVTMKIAVIDTDTFGTALSSQHTLRFCYDDTVVLSLYSLGIDGHFLSLKLVPPFRIQYDMEGRRAKSVEPVKYLERVKVRGVQVEISAADPERCYMSFVFEPKSSDSTDRVYVEGNRSEIKLLSEMMAEWDEIPATWKVADWYELYRY